MIRAGAFIAAIGASLVTTPVTASSIRVCDGHVRHLICTFPGGRSFAYDVGPDEHLSYGPPTLSFTDKGRIHIVVQDCEIICEPER